MAYLNLLTFHSDLYPYKILFSFRFPQIQLTDKVLEMEWDGMGGEGAGAGCCHTCHQLPTGFGNLVFPLRITATCVLEHSGANTKAVAALRGLIIRFVDTEYHQTSRFFSFDPSIYSIPSNCRCPIFNPMSPLSSNYLRVLQMDILSFTGAFCPPFKHCLPCIKLFNYIYLFSLRLCNP